MAHVESSIVLDLHHSARLATRYWEALRTAALGSAPTEASAAARSLAYPLLHYHREELARLSAEERQAFLDFERADLRDDEYLHLGARARAWGLPVPDDSRLVDRDAPTELTARTLALVAAAWPDAHSEARALLTGICWTADADVRSFTSPTWFGAVFLNQSAIARANPFENAVSLLHEVGHLALFAQCSVAPPIEDMRTEIFSPFKGVDRPALGVLHAQMALARMILWIHHVKHFAATNPASPFLRGVSLERLEPWLREFTTDYLAGMGSLGKMTPTPGGEALFVDFRKIEAILR